MCYLSSIYRKNRKLGGAAYTVKTENWAVVLLCVLMDDTPTIDVTHSLLMLCGFFFVLFFYLCGFLCTKNAGVPEFFIVR